VAHLGTEPCREPAEGVVVDLIVGATDDLVQVVQDDLAVPRLRRDRESLPDVEEVRTGLIARVANDAAQVLAPVRRVQPQIGDGDEPMLALGGRNLDPPIAEHLFEVG
jgi:hypothetical protein